VEHWVVMVTDGTVVAFPPEIYESRELAFSEAERWRQTVSGPCEDQRELHDAPPWHVGDFTVRLIEVSASPAEPNFLWVGTYWTADGYPDPEALLLRDRAAARAWVLDPPAGFEQAIDTNESEWFVGSTYLDRGEETYAVAHRAKQVRTHLVNVVPPVPPGLARYDVEVAVSRLQRIEASVLGPPGLSRDGVEDLVQGSWAAISHQVTEDNVVTWELEGYVDS